MCTFFSKVIRLSVIASLSGSPAAFASDPASDFFVGLYIKTCLAFMRQPSEIRKIAHQAHLRVITDPIPLQVFVGDGPNGEAWAVSNANGSFALSIRGMNQACAVWAGASDPEEVEADFKKVIEGTRRSGLGVMLYKDETGSGPSGKTRLLVYQILKEGASVGFLFSMITNERPGGAFQASLQVAASKVTP